MTWQNAMNWVASLTPYGNGITGWRLPIPVDVGNDACTFTNVYQGVDCGYNITTHSEMSYMFYVTLSDKAYYSTSGAYQSDFGLSNTGTFSNIQSYYGYWSAMEYAPAAGGAWNFVFDSGSQGYFGEALNGYAWAVHDGDVGIAMPSSVPLPTAGWLLGSGLIGLLGVIRGKQ